MLLAAAYLSQHRDFAGTVYVIFQPAEEGGGGKRMIDDGLFTRFPMEAVFGMHNWPGMPPGKFGLTPGPIMASSNEFSIVIKGQGHARRHANLGIDPVMAAVQMAQSLQTIITRNRNPLDAAVLSITQIHAGSADNVVPNHAELRGTVRTFTLDVLDLIERRMEEIARHTCAAMDCEVEFKFQRNYPPTINHPDEAAFCAEVLRGIVGETWSTTTSSPPWAPRTSPSCCRNCPAATSGSATAWASIAPTANWGRACCTTAATTSTTNCCRWAAPVGPAGAAAPGPSRRPEIRSVRRPAGTGPLMPRARAVPGAVRRPERHAHRQEAPGGASLASACGTRMLSVRVNGRGSSRNAASAPSSCRIDITDTKPTPNPARTACFTPSTPASSNPTDGVRPASAKRARPAAAPRTRFAHDQRRRGQVAQGHGALARQRMVGAHDRHHFILAPGMHGRVCRQSSGHVALDESQVQNGQPLDDFARVAIRQVQAHGRKRLPEFGHQSRQQVAGRRGAGAQAQHARLQPAPGFAHGLRLPVHLAQWRACSASRSPASVSAMPWPLRRYSGSPNHSCSMRNWPDTAGCDRCSVCAARLMLPVSATQAKVSSWSGVIRAWPLKYQNFRY